MSDIEEPKKATIISDKDVPTKHYSFLFYDRDDAAPFAALKVWAAIIFFICILSLELGGITNIGCQSYDHLAAGLCDAVGTVMLTKNIAFAIMAFLSAIIFTLFFFRKKIARSIAIVCMYLIVPIAACAFAYIFHIASGFSQAQYRFFIITILESASVLVVSAVYAIAGSIYLLKSKKIREILNK